jgi:hypothetical protein
MWKVVVLVLLLQPPNEVSSNQTAADATETSKSKS